MRKTILATFVFFQCLSVNAQKGENILSLGGDIAIPTGDFGKGFNIGPGFRLKMLFGVTEFGYITATSGINFFGAKKDQLGPLEAANMRIIPILVGYRHTFSGFFLEPQLGFGIYGATVKYMGMTESGSSNAFTWAAGFGYMGKNVEVGLRYQSGEKDGQSFPLFGANVSYAFSLGRSRK